VEALYASSHQLRNATRSSIAHENFPIVASIIAEEITPTYIAIATSASGVSRYAETKYSIAEFHRRVSESYELSGCVTAEDLAKDVRWTGVVAISLDVEAGPATGDSLHIGKSSMLRNVAAIIQ
jgi:hypothetical protein